MGGDKWTFCAVKQFFTPTWDMFLWLMSIEAKLPIQMWKTGGTICAMWNIALNHWMCLKSMDESSEFLVLHHILRISARDSLIVKNIFVRFSTRLSSSADVSFHYQHHWPFADEEPMARIATNNKRFRLFSPILAVTRPNLPLPLGQSSSLSKSSARSFFTILANHTWEKCWN